jgi:hypothetical protein
VERPSLDSTARSGIYTGGSKSAHSLGTREQPTIFAKDPTQFKTGKRYLFSVKVRRRRKEGERIEQAELTGYDALEDGSKH